MEEEGINASQFYGRRETIAPVLRASKGIETALRVARSDPKRLYRLFPTQEKAFEFADDHPFLQLNTWSYEIDEKGKRRFVVASYASFWRWYRRCIRRSARLHFYEIIRNGTACKLYFDLEYVRTKNQNVNAAELVRLLKVTVGELCLQDVGEVVELDSTTEKKWSMHLIFQHVLFHDNIQAGEFAERVCAQLETKHPGSLMVRNADNQEVPFVDLAVYTKNRCFRLVGSSKFGKVTRLLPDSHSKEGRLSISEDLFFKSLVCNVCTGAFLRGSARPLQETPFVRRTYIPSGMKGAGCMQDSESVSQFPRMDQYVMCIVQPHQGGIYGITQFRGSSTIMYAIRGGYKYCARIGRHHKSNNVILIADIPTKKMYQKCFDPDCKNFCSEPWDIPLEVFENGQPDAGEGDVSDVALCDMMDELDNRILTNEASGQLRNKGDSNRTAELSDDILNAVMDCVEASIAS